MNLALQFGLSHAHAKQLNAVAWDRQRDISLMRVDVTLPVFVQDSKKGALGSLQLVL
jgi:hypothetical protein